MIPLDRIKHNKPFVKKKEQILLKMRSLSEMR